MLALLGLSPLALPSSKGNRGPPGTHNTIAAYMQSKAAIEANGLSCGKCLPADNAIMNCCSQGASWDGMCEEGGSYTWLAGYEVCNGQKSKVSIPPAHIVHEEMARSSKTEADLTPAQRTILEEAAVRKEERLAHKLNQTAELAQHGAHAHHAAKAQHEQHGQHAAANYPTLEKMEHVHAQKMDNKLDLDPSSKGAASQHNGDGSNHRAKKGRKGGRKAAWKRDKRAFRKEILPRLKNLDDKEAKKIMRQAWKDPESKAARREARKGLRSAKSESVANALQTSAAQ